MVSDTSRLTVWLIKPSYELAIAGQGQTRVVSKERENASDIQKWR